MTYQVRCEGHKKKRRLNDVDYGTLDFILGSTAVVKQLWSIDDAIVDGKCNKNLPYRWKLFYSYVKINFIEIFNLSKKNLMQQGPI